MINQPLDYDQETKVEDPKIDRLRKFGQLLEIAPIIILSVGLLMQSKGLPHWRPVILIGGGVSVAIYTIFSYFMFQMERYTTIEFTLGLFSAVLFPLGVSGILFPQLAEKIDFMAYCLLGCGVLFALGLLLFIFNIKDDRASVFYRSLIARVMLVGAILLRLWV